MSRGKPKNLDSLKNRDPQYFFKGINTYDLQQLQIYINKKLQDPQLRRLTDS
ncbi:MAG: hypothetical protein V7K21_28870 [Nostoc sp.]|uniref:hypothetical protein n=1 Tax=Nostoc sp. TaxID=1180 RepID=UPI002FF756BF